MVVPLAIIGMLILVHFSSNPITPTGPAPALPAKPLLNVYRVNVPQPQTTQQTEAAWVKPAQEILPPVGFDIAAHSIEGFFI